MKNLILLTLVAGTLTSLGGCKARPAYEWGNYEHSLYVYYKKPATAPDFANDLQDTIKDAEHDHAIIAPGLYAEYGYLMLQQGNRNGAVDAFRKEEAQWPESKLFMDHMIEVTTTNSASSTKGTK